MSVNSSASKPYLELTGKRAAEGNAASDSIADNSICAQTDELWMRLESFELNLPQTGLNFTERLARENGWRLDYAERVISEYKRFVYLAMRSGHVACPSEDVDQVWHMHLTYTRSYWDELCGEVLQAPLHHGPTKGGSEEREKYFQLYQRTKESYELLFASAPPEDIWPAAEKRFGEDLQHVRVNAATHWILPKLSANLGRRSVGYGLASIGLGIPLAQLVANPLNWAGPQFLVLFVSLVVLASVSSIILTRVLVSGSGYDFQPQEPNELGPVDLAWLDGGQQRVLATALLGLQQREAVVLDGSLVRPGPRLEEYQTDNRIEELIVNSLRTAEYGRTWRALARDANVGMVSLRQRLEGKGLLVDPRQRANAIAATLLLVGGTALFGAAKIWTGISRERPVGALIVFELLAVATIFALIATLPRVTSAGKELLRSIRKQLRQNPDQLVAQKNKDDVGSRDNLDNSDALLLWGASALGMSYLMSTPYEELGTFTEQSIADPRNASAGGCGGTGCGGDSGCGGAGGCGGGGCGGCGGCGG